MRFSLTLAAENQLSQTICLPRYNRVNLLPLALMSQSRSHCLPITRFGHWRTLLLHPMSPAQEANVNGGRC